MFFEKNSDNHVTIFAQSMSCGYETIILVFLHLIHAISIQRC